MQGDDPEKVRKYRAGMLAEWAPGTEDSLILAVCYLNTDLKEDKDKDPLFTAQRIIDVFAK